MTDTNKKKALNTNSNTYTIVYSAIIVVIVAFLLAFVSEYLKPAQETNVALDKKGQILAALNIRDISKEETAKQYSEVVVSDDIIDEDNNVVTKGTQGGEKAGFALSSADYKKGKLALYVCDVNGETKYVIPIYGMGLWGTINGYIAIDKDKNTIYGAYFDHAGETAGLGAEIKDSRAWQSQFKGKLIQKPGAEGIALAVLKKSDVKDPATQCDAVTGATLTCNGVSAMLKECLGKYIKFLNDK